MFELGYVLFGCLIAGGLLMTFRMQRLLKKRVDQLAREHDILANRVLMSTLNGKRAESSLPSESEAERAAEQHLTDIGRLPSRRPAGAKIVGTSSEGAPSAND
jgi:hypothetical protein